MTGEMREEKVPKEKEIAVGSNECGVKEGIKTFMKEQLDKLHSHAFRPSIYKVPKELRNEHDKFFEPVSVPIGPLHYNAECPAQELKKWCLKNFIDQYEDKEECMESLAQCMSELEPFIRMYYNDKIDLGGPLELAKIMLLDGCFIMELLWNMDDNNGYDHQRKHVEIVLDSVPFLTLQQDLLKIENQLPFIVLKVLAGVRAPGDKVNKRDNNIKNNKDLIRLALNFFDISSTATDSYVGGTPNHLLELVMNALFHPPPGTSTTAVPINVDTNPQQLGDARSASELEFYGISFRAVDSNSKNMADINFSSSSGVLKIPKLNIQESTLWNFMIFEMLSCKTRVVSSYVILMGTLISNDKDVEVLLGSRILAPSGGSDARRIVSMFAEMSAMVNKKNFGFGQLTNKIDIYCKSSYRKMRANFVRRCYDSRWELLNNILLFILTTTQTLFSVLGYNPKSPSGPGK